MLTRQQNRPLCKNCKVRLARTNGISKHGFQKYHKYCNSCSKSVYNNLSEKKHLCECCGFMAIDSCQLDIVYLDGDAGNKTNTNIKTYCANCSRLYRKRSRQKSILDITIDSDVRI